MIILYLINKLKLQNMENNLNINTGMIMDAVNLTKDAPEKNEAMQAAIDNDQIKKLEILTHSLKKLITQTQ